MQLEAERVGRAVRAAIKELYDDKISEKHPCLSYDYIGWCAIASYCVGKIVGGQIIQGAFFGDKQRGYIDHTWVEYEDFVIDPTVQQFDKKAPDVLVIEKDKYSGLAKRRNCTYVKFKDWPRDQRPTKKMVDKIIKTSYKYL